MTKNLNKDKILGMKAGNELDLLVARNLVLDGFGGEKLREKYPLVMYGNDMWECLVFLPSGKAVKSGLANTFSLAACKAALLTAIEEENSEFSKNRKFKQREKWPAWLVKSFYCFTAVLIFVILLNIYLAKEIQTSRIERDGLRSDIEKVQIMEKINWDGITEVFRYKAIRLCFEELIGKYEGRYSQEEKENCILLIDLADERYGHLGLDAPLIFAWLQKESAGDPLAVSWAGAKGLTQLMDFRSDQIFTELGYESFDNDFVFKPVINLAGGIYHLWELLNYWRREGIENQSLALFYSIHSYKWGSLNTQKLFNSEKSEFRPAVGYVNWILNRREKWMRKMKDLIDNKLEPVKMRKTAVDSGMLNFLAFKWNTIS